MHARAKQCPEEPISRSDVVVPEACATSLNPAAPSITRHRTHMKTRTSHNTPSVLYKDGPIWVR